MCKLRCSRCGRHYPKYYLMGVGDEDELFGCERYCGRCYDATLADPLAFKIMPKMLLIINCTDALDQALRVDFIDD